MKQKIYKELLKFNLIKYLSGICIILKKNLEKLIQIGIKKDAL